MKFVSCDQKTESGEIRVETTCSYGIGSAKQDERYIMTLHQNLINGEWAGGDAIANINPSNTNDVVGEYARATAGDTLNAIAAAKAAFPAWSRSGILERHAILRKAADEITARKDELGRLLSREEGKTLAEGIGETLRAAQIFDFFAGEVLRLAGEVLPSARPNIGVEITREPVGVVGIITPWNFPIAIPAWKIAPALAYGNTVVFKPADLVPGCSWAIVDILHRAGLPKGVINLVMGKGSVVGQAILDSGDVNAITFTGSVGTGKRVAAASIEHMRKFQLEMGGKNPFVVLDDADLNVAVEVAVNSAFFSTGQRCTASSRIIVTEGIHDKFVAAATERLKGLVVDDALKAGTHIGPVVDAEPAEAGHGLHRDWTAAKAPIWFLEVNASIGKRPAFICSRHSLPRPRTRCAFRAKRFLAPSPALFGSRIMKRLCTRPMIRRSVFPPVLPQPASNMPRTSSAMRKPGW